VLLGGEVLVRCGDPAVADLQFGHRPSLPVSPPSPGLFTEPVLRDGEVRDASGTRVPVPGVPLGVGL